MDKSAAWSQRQRRFTKRQPPAQRQQTAAASRRLSLCWSVLLVAAAALAVLLLPAPAHAMTATHRRSLRDKAKEMFYHGFSNYMTHAYPEDELNPITCKGRSRDTNPNNWGINDVLGNFSLTLIDSLDALAIMGDKPGFERGVRLVIKHVNFDLDNRVQVFEVTIRVLGGLLSAHMLATDDKIGFKLDWYRGQLLDLARDLGDRLMPAFDTPTGLPYPRINLKRGVLSYEVKEACAAGAGTLILEFGVLSRLTGNPKYEKAAHRALLGVWARRSEIGLVGNTLSIFHERWIDQQAGIGAGIDSFYEYLLKAYILFGDEVYLSMFEEAYGSVMKLIRDENGYIYKNVNMMDGRLITTWIDSLAAFFPGMQVLAGDLPNAIKHHYLYFSIWQRYGALPERFDFQQRDVNIAGYPLRPELIESTYMLYQATKDPFYLYAGEQFLEDFEAMARVKCGFATLSDVRTGKHDERMESFFLSETLKYLYLLFDEDNPINKLDSNFVFTTEGHFLPLPRKYLVKTPEYMPDRVCPASTLRHLRPPTPATHYTPPLSPHEIATSNAIAGYSPPAAGDPVCPPRGLYRSIPAASAPSSSNSQAAALATANLQVEVMYEKSLARFVGSLVINLIACLLTVHYVATAVKAFQTKRSEMAVHE
ncbi:glycoside hydrolase [Entophlyctis helioformis]|nr:glycoside hydrolase [Entophlyctis helioformis]